MRVSHETDHTTNAIIGYEKVEEMGIDSSPEFFNILSSSLYKHQKFAFVRETISNAWDVHTETDQSHVPIEITVTDDEFIIRDHGTGIAPDRIQPVYGIYGKGTKRDNINSIGGFGLGCKSPFAYTDNFEVTSCYNGTRTVYRVTKGSKVAGGKPAIITLFSTPCGEETGITVSIPLKANDKDSLKSMAQCFIELGDIHAILNGEVVETLGMSFEAGTMMIRTDGYMNLHRLPNIHTTMAVRYANVIYPLPEPDAELAPRYVKVYNQIKDLLEGLNCTAYNRFNFLIQAPSNSLSVQPSRESLSETEFTLDSLTTLLTTAVRKYWRVFESVKVTSLNNHFAAMEASAFNSDGDMAECFPTTGSRRYTEEDQASLTQLLTTYKSCLSLDHNQADKLVQHAIRLLPTKLNTPKEWAYAVSKVVRINAINNNTSYGRHGDYRDHHNFYQDNSHVTKAVTKWYKNIVTAYNHHRLYYFFDSHCPVEKRVWRVTLPNQFYLRHPYYLHMLGKRTVVLTSNLRKLPERIYQHNRFVDDKSKRIEAALIYHVKPGKRNLEQARKLLEASGYDFRDFTHSHAWEKAVTDSTKLAGIPTSTKPKLDRNIKKDSLPALASIFENESEIDTRLSCRKDAQRVSDPLGVILVYINQNTPTHSLYGLMSEYLTELNRHLGDKIGIVSTKPQESKWRKQAKANHLDLMVELCLQQWKIHKKEILQYYSTVLPSNREEVENQIGCDYKWRRHTFLSKLHSNGTEYLPYKVHTLGKEAKAFLRLYRVILNQGNNTYDGRKHIKPLEVITDTIDKAPLSKSLISFYQRTMACDGFAYLALGTLEEDLEQKNVLLTHPKAMLNAVLSRLIKDIRKTKLTKEKP